MLRQSVLHIATLSLMMILIATVNTMGTMIDPNLWSEDVRITFDQTDSELPNIVGLANGDLGLLWIDIIQSEADTRLLFMSRPDTGRWGNTIVAIPPGSDKGGGLELGAEGRLHLASSDNRTGNYEIYHSYSDDDGLTWSTPNQLTNAANESWNVSMRTHGQNVYCIWDDNRSGMSGWSYHPAVYFRSSYDNGITWNTEVKISSNATNYAWWPRLLVDEAGTLHVAWHDQRGGALEIFYNYSIDNGVTWHEDAPLTIDDDTASDNIAWVLDPDGAISLFWVDRKAPDTQTNPGVYYRRSIGDISAGVKEWTAPIRLTAYVPKEEVGFIVPMAGSYLVSCGAPCCAFVGDVLHLAWSNYLVTETPGGESHNSWIYWMCSLDNGSTWSEPIIISEVNNVIKGLTCAPYKKSLFLAWSDNRDGNLEIYTKAMAPQVPFHEGVNLTKWFETGSVGTIDVNMFREQDFNDIKSLGCDVIRLPINLHFMTNGAPDYAIDPLFFTYLDPVIDWSEELEMHLILDNHTPAVIADGSTDPDVDKVLVPVWRQMADHYKDRSEYLYYEVLNEPHGIDDAAWGQIQQRVIDAIRDVDETHTIIVTGSEWGGYDNLENLPVYRDDNLIYSFHFYDPKVYTHQGAVWTEPSMASLAGVPFPSDAGPVPACPPDLIGTWVEGELASYEDNGTEEHMMESIDKVVAFRNGQLVPVFCGEFGVYMAKTTNEQRVYWYEVVRSYFQEKAIPWTMWDYKGDFGLFQAGTNEDFPQDLNVPLLEALGLMVPE